MKVQHLVQAVAIAATGSARAVSIHQFEHFFPSWNVMIQGFLAGPCKTEYSQYRVGRIDAVNGTGSVSSRVSPVVECILGEFPDFRKAELGASAVVLGSLPMILQTLGSTTAETALVSLKRPVLGLLLASGSPAVLPLKESEFIHVAQSFIDRGQASSVALSGIQWGELAPTLRLAFSLGQYVFLAGAVGNVAYLAYQLGARAIVVFAPETTFMIPLWIALGLVIHLAGFAVLRIRVRTITLSSVSSFREKSSSTIAQEFTPSAFQEPRRFEWRKTNTAVHVLAWIMNVGIVGHIVFGTLVLSSLLFFSVIDAVIVVARFVLSAVVCRAIVLTELSGMQYARVSSGVKETNGEDVRLTDMNMDQG